MGWNGSGSGSTPVKPKGAYPPSEASFAKQSGYRGAKKPSPVRGIVAGGLVCILAVGAYFAFFSGSEKPQKVEVEKQRGRIKEVTPAVAPKPVEEEAPKVEKVDPNARPTRVGQLLNGYRLLPSGKMHRVLGVTTSHVARLSFEDKVFEKSSDRRIASLLMAKPGITPLGDSSMYYKDFNEKFLDSLKTPIIIAQDDDEDVKELKRAVIDVRKELKDRYDAGEDLSKVMQESREQLRELGLYREEINKQVRDILANKDDLSDTDIKDLIDAANLMLKDRGVEPLHIGAAFGYQLRSQYNTKEQPQEGAKETQE